ncbi:NAD-dependent epimerase/dehydratase family protein [Paenibacillus aurantiacus]|uniref:NAD-dependent epimerase/dehydratase family protein n=1 Tax=Paenibacillus aurantiacus TaxID=1936118 RepID=A0ABV5KXT0_9BACL
MKKVLVTGGDGWIGSFAIPSLLAKGYDVHVVSRKNKSVQQVLWHTADLLDQRVIDDLMRTIQPEYLLHFAWETAPGQCWTSLNNYRWVQSSLELLRTFALYGGKRVVMAGSCAEYDWHHGYLSEEASPLSYATPYAASKNAMRQLLISFSESADISYAWGRLFFVYGPGEHPARLVASVIRSLLAGQEARCTDGYQARDYMHVADVGDAFSALLDSGVRGTVNIASGQSVRVRDLVSAIAEKVGKRELVRFGAIPFPAHEPLWMAAATERLNHEASWRPWYDLDAGLNQTIAWWEEHLGGGK